MKLLVITALLVICVPKSYHMETHGTYHNNKDAVAQLAADITKHRTKRGIWDIFQKTAITGNLIIDQYTDTRDTLAEVYNLFNDQFTDPNPPKPTGRPAPTQAPKVSIDDTTDSSETVKTTTERYRISQFELGQILGRNLRGLQRLANIELQDAFNATQYNLQEYRAEASKQFANSLASETKKRVNNLTKG